MTIPTVEQLQKQIFQKEKLIAKHYNQLSLLKKTLRNVCTHENVTVKEYHNEGSYLNRAYTEYRHTCRDCGQELETTTEVHSYYG